jgi:hypothetical protein
MSTIHISNTRVPRRWSNMTDDERDAFLRDLKKRRNRLQRHVREVLEVEEPEGPYDQYQRDDIYREGVLGFLRPAEAEAIESSAYWDDDQTDRFSEHCAAGHRRGWSQAKCARQWRCRPA